MRCSYSFVILCQICCLGSFYLERCSPCDLGLMIHQHHGARPKWWPCVSATCECWKRKWWRWNTNCEKLLQAFVHSMASKSSFWKTTCYRPLAVAFINARSALDHLFWLLGAQRIEAHFVWLILWHGAISSCLKLFVNGRRVSLSLNHQCKIPCKCLIFLQLKQHVYLVFRLNNFT